MLPGSIRKFDTRWKRPPLIGRFTAQATMKYGTKQQVAHSEKYIFYVIPWGLLLIILLVLVTIGYLIFRVISLSKRLRRAEVLREEP